MSSDQKSTTPSKKPGLPITVGQLGMWIFISTEIMLFAGIIAVYLVFRLTSLDSGWPTRTDMHVYTESGITMTIFLVFSAVCAWQSWTACSEDRPRAARLWLILTILLGFVFLGIKYGTVRDPSRSIYYLKPESSPSSTTRNMENGEWTAIECCNKKKYCVEVTIVK